MLPLAEALRQSVVEPLLGHVKYINRSVVVYMLEDKQLLHHLEGIRQFVLMKCGEFGNVLTDLLCEGLHRGDKPVQLAATGLLRKAIESSLQVEWPPLLSSDYGLAGG